ncbi:MULTISPECIES: PepSY domain-containing protein [Aquincola]|uniref:PepSY domain-containing protein n=1 Tax=Aquincola TaxID=391952 RepID=UPI000614D7FD|nr:MULTISPECIES: PepSY domain-containing protein [Aquincola]MCR5866521.1 PepSY domain-containing protein [Aquincola sp. J276]
MFKLTASTLLALALPLLGGNATAGPTCQAPKAQWMKEADFKAKLQAEGYRIKTFKVTKGQCYEIYGHDKAGKKVEIYFDPVTAAVLESK